MWCGGKSVLEAFKELTAITDPAANIAIIGIAYWLFKQQMKLATQDVRLTNLERKVFKQ